MNIEIYIYMTAAGRAPFSEWLNELDLHSRAIIRTRIDRVRLGNFGDAKPIVSGNGIWELRIDYGPGYRIYYGKQGRSLVILLIGGSKGSQNRDLTKAKKFWLDYRSTHE